MFLPRLLNGKGIAVVLPQNDIAAGVDFFDGTPHLVIATLYGVPGRVPPVIIPENGTIGLQSGNNSPGRTQRMVPPVVSTTTYESVSAFNVRRGSTAFTAPQFALYLRTSKQKKLTFFLKGILLTFS